MHKSTFAFFNLRSKIERLEEIYGTRRTHELGGTRTSGKALMDKTLSVYTARRRKALRIEVMNIDKYFSELVKKNDPELDYLTNLDASRTYLLNKRSIENRRHTACGEHRRLTRAEALAARMTRQI